jgi:hypothetical protein
MKNKLWIWPLHKKRYRVKCMNKRSNPVRAMVEKVKHYIQVTQVLTLLPVP